MYFYGHGEEFAMLEDAIEAGGMAWWLMELPSKLVFFSPNKLYMMGFKKSDIPKFTTYTDFTDRLHPDDYPKAMQAMMDHIEGRSKIYETQYRIMGADNQYRTFYDRGRIVGRKDGNLAISGIVLNVTSHAPAAI